MTSLEGFTVVVTRAAHQAPELTSALRNEGADVVELPTIEIVPPDDGGAALADAFENLDQYEWLVVTSLNTVTHIRDLLDERVRALKVAAIGSATADGLRELSVEVDLVPEEFVAESLLDAFPSGAGAVLLPRATVAREVLPEGLRAKGWQVDVVPAYKTVRTKLDSEARSALQGADAITFTASSTVDAFVESFDLADIPPLVACIGPITAETAQRHGINVGIVAEDHTIPGLVKALAEGKKALGQR